MGESVDTSVADWYARTGVTCIIVLVMRVVPLTILDSHAAGEAEEVTRDGDIFPTIPPLRGLRGRGLGPEVPAPADNVGPLSHFSQDFFEDNSSMSSLSLILPQSFSSPTSTTGIISR